MGFKIFESGQMSGLERSEYYGWRKEFKEKLLKKCEECGCYFNKVKVVNPVDYYDLGCDDEVEAAWWDLHQVETSDLVVCKNINNSIGTSYELGLAADHNIPIVYIVGDDDTLHPFHEMVVGYYCCDIDDAVDLIWEKYLN